MDADCGDPRTHGLFIKKINEVLVVELSRVFRGPELERVAGSRIV
jgi:hypothetical protein